MSESIKDILREMRGYAADMAERFKNAVKGDRHLDCNIISFRIGEFAIRIKQAHEREVVVSKNETTTKENLAVGDAAKTRKALMDVAELIQDEAKWADEMSYQQAIALGIIQSALAEPPRNCDLYANPKEAGEAFVSEACENPCGNCTVSDECHNPLIHECGIKWLFAKAKGV